MGGRLIRDWISQPTTDRNEIQRRLNGVENLVQHHETRTTLNELLPDIYDIERLSIKVSHCSSSPRDLIALKKSIEKLPELSNVLKPLSSEYIEPLHNLPPELFRLMAIIDQAITESPPIGLMEGGLLKTGYNQELDELRHILNEQEAWRDSYQQAQRDETGIKTLKIGYNNAFGYFIEMSRNQSHLAPETYHRKQTLTAVERFTTPILKEQEAKVLDAQSRQYQLEYSLFTDLRDALRPYATPLQQVAYHLARLDVLQSFANIAVERDYVKPVIDDSYHIQLQDARHPVVEATTPMGQFVANHTHISSLKSDHPIIPQLMLITGPNMSGKSTYMRQVAMVVLMAQMGSFVPATYARIGYVDRIFTRIGAMDDLSSGQSTFMVEMQETAQILHGASQRSLVLLDEVGRGTSTSDGIAIARSVIDYIVNHIGCRTLFATHYHELNDMEAMFPAIQNVRVRVAETETPSGLHVEFLHKVEPGTAQKSYGVHVAKMAGLPQKVINQSERLLRQYDTNPVSGAARQQAKKQAKQNSAELPPQLQLFGE
jgi:DNA mismatch repair protein MutS